MKKNEIKMTKSKMTKSKMTKADSKKKEILKKKLISALRGSAGLVSHACQIAGCSRNTYYEYLNNDEKFKKEVESISEEVIDEVESALMGRIKKGDTTAIIFHLKTKGRSRGYIERQEIDHSFSGDVARDFSKYFMNDSRKNSQKDRQ